jgi:hypothetical protein
MALASFSVIRDILHTLVVGVDEPDIGTSGAHFRRVGSVTNKVEVVKP